MGEFFDPPTLISMMEKRNVRGLAKAISMVEDGDSERDILLDYAYHKKTAPVIVVGITGPGGAGKSTFIDRFITEYRRLGKTVGVIAVDPSSPYTGGAFLGDRVRMGVHNIDDGVFIRSFGSRNCYGGISEAAKNVLYLYKAFHFDVIILESIGVGQDQTDISNFVDVNVLVMVPGFGDSMQMAKAGIKEAADIFVINKSDKPEAAIFKEQVSNSFGNMPLECRPPIFSTIANAGVGITDVIEAVGKISIKQAEFAEKKSRERIWSEITTSVTYKFHQEIEAHVLIMVEKVLKGALTPYAAAKKISECISYRPL
jgi:LAO/AO transport system kinase